MRKHEVSGENLSGSFYYHMGIFVTFLLYSKTVACLSLLYLTIGDPCASLVGIVTGGFLENKATGKSLFASFVNAFVCLIISFFFIGNCCLPVMNLELRNNNPLRTAVLIISVCGGIASAFFEGIISSSRPRPFPFDDNFIIPVCSGIALLIHPFDYI